MVCIKGRGGTWLGLVGWRWAVWGYYRDGKVKYGRVGHGGVGRGEGSLYARVSSLMFYLLIQMLLLHSVPLASYQLRWSSQAELSNTLTATAPASSIH